MSKPSNKINPSLPVEYPAQKEDKLDKWFTEFIDNLKVDHFLLKTKSAPKEKEEFYNSFISGDATKAISLSRKSSSEFFVKKLIFDYLNELKDFQSPPLKLAFGLSDSKILVWSEINDDDDSAEDALLITEAKINGKYYPYGFFINSTIIEKSDRVPVPPHYQTVL